ncbi:MAG: S8 family serine peptidase [Candidatus Bipolaricaulota bacterium]|nr:S8 family serine peptidase [Candidatus Bipolaricaulota bacterium]MDW8031187.1 S8 family serine peptidase [Candidatus Bipolaricaulota bacterium]
MRRVFALGVLLIAMSAVVFPNYQAHEGRSLKIQELLAESLTAFESGLELPSLPANNPEDLKAGKVRLVLEATEASEVQGIQARVAMLGGHVEAVYENLVQAFVPIKAVNALAELSSVSWVRTPFVPLWEQGGSVSEGVRVIGANLWHEAGIKGQGVKVAIIDAGFMGYKRLLGSELPPAERVIVRSFTREENIEANQRHGTAVAEIVYDLVPEATFYLVNFDSDVQLGRAIDFLISEGVHVINTSFNFLGTGCPWEGTGLIEPIVKKARDAGIFWAVSVGNHATEHWQGIFDDPDRDGFHNFLGDDEGLTIEVEAQEGSRVIAVLGWEDKCGQATENYELLLFDDADRRRSSGGQLRLGWPSRLLIFTPRESGRYHLKIRQRSATKPTARLDLTVVEFEPEYAVWEGSVGIFEPAISPSAYSVGAVDFRNDSARRYSSRGPTKDGRIKPDFVAPDGVRTVSFRQFFGTSAASPHVAGAAALVKSARPQWGPKEIADFLASRAVDRGDDGPDNTYGLGRIALGEPLQEEKPADVIIGVFPEKLKFVAQANGPAPAPQLLEIANLGAGDLIWTAQAQAAFVKLSATQGIGQAVLHVSVDTAGLAVGTHQSEITITAERAQNSPFSVPIEIQITEGAPTGELIALILSKVEFANPSAWARSERSTDGCFVYTNNSAEAQRIRMTLADGSTRTEYDISAGKTVTLCGDIAYIDLR